MTENHFHDIGSIFPGEVRVETIPPNMKVGDALRLMLEKRFSQLPVVEDGEVLGVFSLWSLAHHLSLSPGLKGSVVLQELGVADVMEEIPRVNVNDSIHSVLQLLERHEALLVDSPHGLQAVLTSSDVLRYFYQVARPYILLQEIEIALREIIEACAPGEKLKEIAQRALANAYEKRTGKPPEELREMTFDDYRSIIVCKDNWPLFGTLGQNRDLISAKLASIGRIRNEVFHFRSEISVLDYQTLANAREWLLSKLRRVQAHGGNS
jgi:CBS domain-containing protein